MKVAINGILQSVELSKSAKEPENCVLSGPAGTGKTTICNIIVNKFKKSLQNRVDREVWIVPAFYALIPSPVTIKGMASAMLHSLGDSAPTRGNALELTYRLGMLLKQCETKVIILDELQHLLILDNGRNNHVKDWIKTIINEFKVPIVIVGVDDCDKVISSSAQLSRRFTSRYQLKNLSFGAKKKGQYRKFIDDFSKGYKEVVEISTLPDFRTRTSCLALYVATSGNPSDTVRLFKKATLNAFDNDRTDVRVTDFSKAMKQIVLPNAMRTKLNPFDVTLNQLNQIVQANTKRVKK